MNICDVTRLRVPKKTTTRKLAQLSCAAPQMWHLLQRAWQYSLASENAMAKMAE